MGCSICKNTVLAEPPIPITIKDLNQIPTDVTPGSNQENFVYTNKESKMMITESELMVKLDH